MNTVKNTGVIIPNLQAVSQSRLKTIMGNPEDFRDFKYTSSDKPHFVLGHVVEAYLLFPPDEALVRAEANYFFTSGESSISDAFKDIIHRYVGYIWKIIETQEEPVYPKDINIFTDFEQCLVSALIDNGWNPKWTIPVKLPKLRTVDVQSYLTDYLSFLLASTKADGTQKVIIDKELLTKGQMIAAIVKQSSVYQYCIENAYSVTPFLRFNTPYIVRSAEGTPLFKTNLEGEIDLVVVLTEGGVPIRIDIKTYSDSLASFEQSAYTYKYDIQDSFYKKGSLISKSYLMAINTQHNMGQTDLCQLIPRQESCLVNSMLVLSIDDMLKIAAIHSLLNVWNRSIFSILVDVSVMDGTTSGVTAIRLVPPVLRQTMIQDVAAFTKKLDTCLEKIIARGITQGLFKDEVEKTESKDNW